MAAVDSIGSARAGRTRRVVALQVVAPLTIYAASRVVQLVLVAALAGPGRSVGGRLTIWDAGFFLHIAASGYEHGYTHGDDGRFLGNTLAFFPGYPACVRALAVLGLPYPAAGVAVSLIAGGAGAVLIHLLGRQLRGPRFGYVLAVLFCAQPMSIVFSMAYSEALFCALVLAMLLAMRHRYWLTAGAFGAAAGLTRVTGLAAALALAAYAGHRLWADRRFRVRPVVASVVALAAVPAFWLWVGLRVGHLDAWFVEQRRGWGTSIDWGEASARFVAATFRTADGFVPIATAFLLVGTGALVVAATLRRTWWPFALYGLLAYASVAGSAGYFNSRPRLLVPVLVALSPIAEALAAARTAVLVPCLVGLGLAGCWFGAYMITVWPYTI
jgi:mannosyltransferase PIG-V